MRIAETALNSGKDLLFLAQVAGWGERTPQQPLRGPHRRQSLPVRQRLRGDPLERGDREAADGFHVWLDEYARKAATGEDVARRLAHARHDGTQRGT